GLNLFAGGEYFHLHEIENRLQSGNAQRAVEGRIPLWELPPQVAQAAGIPSVEEQNAIEAFLKASGEKIQDLLGGIENHLRRRDLLTARKKNAPSPPNPWVSSAIILGISLGLCSVALFGLGTMVGALVVFLLGTALAGVLFTKEMTGYKQFLEKQKEEMKVLEKKQKTIDREIKEVEAEIEVHRSNARKRLDKTSAFSEDEKGRIRAAHPLVFPLPKPKD